MAVFLLDDWDSSDWTDWQISYSLAVELPPLETHANKQAKNGWVFSYVPITIGGCLSRKRMTELFFAPLWIAKPRLPKRRTRLRGIGIECVKHRQGYSNTSTKFSEKSPTQAPQPPSPLTKDLESANGGMETHARAINLGISGHFKNHAPSYRAYQVARNKDRRKRSQSQWFLYPVDKGWNQPGPWKRPKKVCGTGTTNSR